MPVNLHNLSSLAQKSGSDKIPGLWRFVTGGQRRRGAFFCSGVYMFDYSLAKYC